MVSYCLHWRLRPSRSEELEWLVWKCLEEHPREMGPGWGRVCQGCWKQQVLFLLSVSLPPAVLQPHLAYYPLMKWKSLSHVWLSVTPWTIQVGGILQARILEWVAFPFSKGSSQPRDRIQVSHIGGGFLTSWATREAHITLLGSPKWGKQETALSVLAVPNQASFVSS